MPGVLWELLQEHLIDYVAMDIKASRDNYARAAGLPHIDISHIEESIGILKSSGIPYEFRTTVVKGIHRVEEFEDIGKWIAGCPAYYLQNYEENENCLYRMIQTAECDDVKPGGVDPFGAFSKEELEQMEELAQEICGETCAAGRGIDAVPRSYISCCIFTNSSKRGKASVTFPYSLEIMTPFLFKRSR